MSDEFDERQEVVEKKKGYYWNIQVQLGSASERVKVKEGGNAENHIEGMDQVQDATENAVNEVKEAHDKLTEENDEDG